MSDITNDSGSTVEHGPVKVGYLVTGLVFVGLAGSWALDASGTIDGVTVGWLLPAILVGAGVIGLVAMLASGVRRSRPAADSSNKHGIDDSAGFDEPSDNTHKEDHR